MIFFLLAQAQQVDPLSGGAGWVGAGLLGCCLAWLFFWHLPAKDKQIKDMNDATSVLVEANAARIEKLFAMQTTERDKESIARHGMISSFQSTISQIEKDHLVDANNDRAAFSQRNDSLILAITQQTADLRNAIIAGACKFKPVDAMCPVMHDGQMRKDK